MADRKRNTTIAGGGTLSRLYLPKLRAECDALGITPAVICMGAFELNRVTNNQRTDFGRDGVIDVSPDPKDIALAIGNLGSDEIAQENRVHWESLSQAMIQGILKVHADNHVVDGQLYWKQGMRTGHALPAEETLRELKLNQPKMHVVTSSVLPDDFNKRQLLRTGYDLFNRLQQDNITYCTFLSDNNGPFATTYKLDIQDRFLTRAEASLLGAQFTNAKAQSIGEIARSLGRYSPFAGWASVSRQLIVTKPVFGWSVLQKALGFPDRGYGDLENAIHQAKLATEQVLTEPTARLIAEEIDTKKLLFLVYTVPIPGTERQRWIDFASEIRRWLVTRYETAVPVFAVGNGCSRPSSPPGYYVQVSALFPIPAVPTPIRELLASPIVPGASVVPPPLPQPDTEMRGNHQLTPTELGAISLQGES